MIISVYLTIYLSIILFPIWMDTYTCKDIFMICIAAANVKTQPTVLEIQDIPHMHKHMQVDLPVNTPRVHASKIWTYGRFISPPDL